MNLKIHAYEPRPGVGIVRIEGSVDASNVVRLTDVIEGLLEHKVYRLVINLAKETDSRR